MDTPNDKVTIVGKVVEIGNERVFTKCRCKSITIVTDGDRPKYITFDFFNDKCDYLSKYPAGTPVVCTGYLGGRKWDTKDAAGKAVTKYFLSLTGSFIEKQGGDAGTQEVADVEDPVEDMPF